jgi:hypothetical protein
MVQVSKFKNQLKYKDIDIIIIMKQSFKINEHKINEFINEFNDDRTIIFNDIRTASKNDKIKEDKIKYIETIHRALLNYRKLLIKEKDNNDI